MIPQLYSGRIDKKALSVNNFMQALDSLDLEDLVAMYIIHENSLDGTECFVLPSSCKVNEPTFEFRIIAGKKIITCQVKNNREVKVKDYYAFASNFKAIYIFSGKTDYNVGEYLDKPENLILISHRALFEYVKENDYFKNVLSSFFIFEE